jgi:hypothetical protein
MCLVSPAVFVFFAAGFLRRKNPVLNHGFTRINTDFKTPAERGSVSRSN